MFYNALELNLINCAHNHDKFWNCDDIKKVKDEIKEYLMLYQKFCCYCQRSFRDEFKMVIDIEHILPSSIFRDLAFNISNLSLSCKRCNMEIKKDKLNFTDNSLLLMGNFLKNKENKKRYIAVLFKGKNISSFDGIVFNRDNYKIIHPTLDEYSDHIDVLRIQVNSVEVISYQAKSPKGKFTKDFFQLVNFEVGGFNKAQGLELIENMTKIITKQMI